MTSANCSDFFTPPPLSLSKISWFCSFRLLFGEPPPPTTADVINASPLTPPAVPPTGQSAIKNAHTGLAKKVCPRLRDLATAPIAQPRTNFFGQLCTGCSIWIAITFAAYFEHSILYFWMQCYFILGFTNLPTGVAFTQGIKALARLSNISTT